MAHAFPFLALFSRAAFRSALPWFSFAHACLLPGGHLWFDADRMPVLAALPCAAVSSR